MSLLWSLIWEDNKLNKGVDNHRGLLAFLGWGGRGIIFSWLVTGLLSTCANRPWETVLGEHKGGIGLGQEEGMENLHYC